MVFAPQPGRKDVNQNLYVNIDASRSSLFPEIMSIIHDMVKSSC